MRQRFRRACRELKLSRHCEILEMQQKRKIPPVSLTDGAYFQSGKLQWREPETASCVCTVKVRWCAKGLEHLGLLLYREETEKEKICRYWNCIVQKIVI